MKTDRFLSILSGIVSVGEHEKVVQGIFENYPNTKYRDPSMRMVSGTEVASTYKGYGFNNCSWHTPQSSPSACAMLLCLWYVSLFPDGPRVGVDAVPGRGAADHHVHTELQSHPVPAIRCSGSPHPPSHHREPQDTLPSPAV